MVRLRWARLLDLARELDVGFWQHGAAAKLARALGVSRWTVARDIKQIRAAFIDPARGRMRKRWGWKVTTAGTRRIQQDLTQGASS
jgi:predicted DNA-binding transcriptional regulator YafY